VGELIEEMNAHRRLGVLAGETLLIVAVMARHHRDLPPSLNRAMAVMEAHPGNQPGRNERELKEAWLRWRPVAPFWAASLALSTPLGAGLWQPSPGADKSAEWLRIYFGLAEGFRRFAACYKPPRARGPLIPEGEAVEFRGGGPAITPVLQPLQHALYETARAYTVRAIRQ
jgi:hypothetical protein